jgi:hypothetical protein
METPASCCIIGMLLVGAFTVTNKRHGHVHLIFIPYCTFVDVDCSLERSLYRLDMYFSSSLSLFRSKSRVLKVEAEELDPMIAEHVASSSFGEENPTRSRASQESRRCR